MKREKGALTVEAVFIMGILIFCIGAAVECLFYKYDEIALQALAEEAIWEYAWEEEAFIEEKIRERAEGRLIQVRLEEVSVKKGVLETTADYRARFIAPVPGIQKLLPERGTIVISGTVSSGRFPAAEMIRIRHAWEKEGGDLNAGSLQK